MDLRVKRSKAAIRNAVVSLLRERPDQDISAKDVADRALINKKTFYAHYPSVHAVVDELEQDALDEIAMAMNVGDVRTASGLFKVLGEMKRLASDGTSTFGSLVRTPVHSDLTERMRRDLVERINKLSNASGQLSAAVSSKVSCAVDFAAGGILSLADGWISGERTLSQEELSQTVHSAVTNCLTSVRSLTASEGSVEASTGPAGLVSDSGVDFSSEDTSGEESEATETRLKR